MDTNHILYINVFLQINTCLVDGGNQ